MRAERPHQQAADTRETGELMDRRAFFKRGALLGASGIGFLGTSSCTTILPPLGRMRSSDEDMDDYVSRVDQGLHGIESWNLAGDAGLDPADPRYERTNRIGRKALSGLYMTAMFSDLSVEDQMHPAMQKRMLDVLPQVSETADEIEDYLVSRTPEQRRATAAILGEEGSVAETFFAALDEHAQASGVIAERRQQTRVMYDEIVWRLRHQPGDLVIDEYRNKLTKLDAFSGPEAGPKREQVAKAGERAFWEWQRGEPDPAMQRAILALAEDPPAKVQSGRDVPEDEKEGEAGELPESKADKPHPAARGAKMMGIGLLIFGVSAALTAAGAYPFVFVATVGAIWFLVGLITLLGDSLSAA